jgi:drug/metabolite transporter (DMT)-like permease
MRPRDVIDLLLLGAIWGGSFPFMRAAVPEFQPLALIAVRVMVAAACLAPLLVLRGLHGALRQNALHLGIAGVFNSALPFCLLAFATLTLPAGYAAVLNATAPMFVAVVAYVWLRQRLRAIQAAGLTIGFAGVLLLVWGKLGVTTDPPAVVGAVAAGLAATLSYGFSANHARRHLAGVDPLVSAAGSQLAASAVLLPLAVIAWPAAPVSAMAWGSVLVLGALCTAVAYILYFRLIAHVGPARAITVTYLVPLFAMLWAVLFLGEPVTWSMLAACAVILLGTALSTGLVPRRAA